MAGARRGRLLQQEVAAVDRQVYDLELREQDLEVNALSLKAEETAEERQVAEATEALLQREENLAKTEELLEACACSAQLAQRLSHGEVERLAGTLTPRRPLLLVEAWAQEQWLGEQWLPYAQARPQGRWTLQLERLATGRPGRPPGASLGTWQLHLSGARLARELETSGCEDFVFQLSHLSSRCAGNMSEISAVAVQAWIWGGHAFLDERRPLPKAADHGWRKVFQSAEVPTQTEDNEIIVRFTREQFTMRLLLHPLHPVHEVPDSEAGDALLEELKAATSRHSALLEQLKVMRPLAAEATEEAARLVAAARNQQHREFMSLSSEASLLAEELGESGSGEGHQDMLAESAAHERPELTDAHVRLDHADVFCEFSDILEHDQGYAKIEVKMRICAKYGQLRSAALMATVPLEDYAFPSSVMSWSFRGIPQAWEHGVERELTVELRHVPELTDSTGTGSSSVLKLPWKLTAAYRPCLWLRADVDGSSSIDEELVLPVTLAHFMRPLRCGPRALQASWQEACRKRHDLFIPEPLGYTPVRLRFH
ncbi:unnamed protein product [Effrenium voratum]|nr:unnamed protein product [Effrenium voratum]